MSLARIVKVSAESTEGFEAAIRNGIGQASKTLEHIKGAWVSEQKLRIENGQITAYRVDMRVTLVTK